MPHDGGKLPMSLKVLWALGVALAVVAGIIAFADV